MLFFLFYLHLTILRLLVYCINVIDLSTQYKNNSLFLFCNGSPEHTYYLSPLCPLHEQTATVAGRWWCPQCKWGHRGSRSATSNKCCLESGRERPSELGWTTHSNSMPDRPAASTTHTWGLGKETNKEGNQQIWHNRRWYFFLPIKIASILNVTIIIAFEVFHWE